MARLFLALLPASGHRSSLSSPGHSCRSLSPSRESISRLERSDTLRRLAPLSCSSNLPVCLSVHSAWSQMQLNLLSISLLASCNRYASRFLRPLPDLCCWGSSVVLEGGRSGQVGSDDFLLFVRCLIREHTESSSSGCARCLWQSLISFEDDADELSLGMLHRIAVVLDITWCPGVDGMVSALQMSIRVHLSRVIQRTMKQLSPGNHRVPLCLYNMFPVTTYSPAIFFAPNRFPGPCLALLARP